MKLREMLPSECSILISEQRVARLGKKHAWSILNVYNDWWEPGALNWGADEKPPGYLPIFFAISMDKVTGREALVR